VSESKFRQDPAAFIAHIQRRDTEALAALITKPEVERRLLIRLRKKAMLYAQDFASDGELLPDCTSKGKIDVDCVVDLYESYIIPLTKEVEVRYKVHVLPVMVRPSDEISRLSICYRGWMACPRRR
jgi:chorismate mutase